MVYLLRKLTQHILKILNKSHCNLRKRTAITRQSHSGETTMYMRQNRRPFCFAM